MTANPTNRHMQKPPTLKLVASGPSEDDPPHAADRNQTEPRVGTPPHRAEKLRILEAVLFASKDPLTASALAAHLDADEDVSDYLAELQTHYVDRGVTLCQVAGRWAFRTADDLGYLLQKHATSERRLSKAALETLAIIAYHQPVTRAEIEEIRGVSTSKGTLDVLLETLWVRPRGRRRAPGRPVTYGTTPQFLDHFGLDVLADLPGLADLKGAGLLDSTVPTNFQMPQPTDIAGLMPDELPLDDDDEDSGQDGLPFDDAPDDVPDDVQDDAVGDTETDDDVDDAVATTSAEDEIPHHD